MCHSVGTLFWNRNSRPIIVGQGPAVLAAGTCTSGNCFICFGGEGRGRLNFIGYMPGNKTVKYLGFLAFFCNIKCKLYYNNMHKHAPSIECIFLAFFHEIQFSCI